jgi:nucleotide-binding universal stress UspA family protein
MSSYKTIVVHLDSGARRGERLALGLELAERFDAHLVGLFALEAMYIPSFALAEAGALASEIEERRRKDTEREAEAEFRKAAARRGGKAEWRASSRDALNAIRLSARYADLVIAGQPERDNAAPGMSSGFAADLLLSAGRPVLLVPFAGRFPSAGKKVLVAWNASREAARAVTDALPLLEGASLVEVVAFDPGRGGEHGELPGADIGLYLSRHGVKVTAARQLGTGIDVGSQILSRAADIDADLIVMGAYGHSRTRELVLGGATRTLLESMTVPVLMSH